MYAIRSYYDGRALRQRPHERGKLREVDVPLPHRQVVVAVTAVVVQVQVNQSYNFV